MTTAQPRPLGDMENNFPPEQSPLLPAAAQLTADDALRELFERDPLALTRPDFERMLDWARDARARWQSEEAAARSTGRKPRSKVAALPKAGAVDPDEATL